MTLTGWSLLLRGLLLLLLPETALPALLVALRLPDLAPLHGGIGLLFGLYLAWAGFSRG